MRKTIFFHRDVGDEIKKECKRSPSFPSFPHGFVFFVCGPGTCAYIPIPVAKPSPTQLLSHTPVSSHMAFLKK